MAIKNVGYDVFNIRANTGHQLVMNRVSKKVGYAVLFMKDNIGIFGMSDEQSSPVATVIGEQLRTNIRWRNDEHHKPSV